MLYIISHDLFLLQREVCTFSDLLYSRCPPSHPALALTSTEITPSAHTHSAEDIEGLSISAENTTYNNTTSGLEATSVQDAIDELFSMINTLIASLGTQVTYEYDATNVSLNIVPIETEEGA